MPSQRYCLAAVFLIFVPAIGSFMEPRILGGKDAIMLGPIIEGQFNAAFNWPLGAALSITLMFIVMVALLVYVRYAGKSGARHG